MTGNKIAWRAPLAGLASLAMVATMGVVAATAGAVDAYTEVADGATITFKTDGVVKFTKSSYSATEQKESDTFTIKADKDGNLTDEFDEALSALPELKSGAYTGWYESLGKSEAVVAADTKDDAARTVYLHYSFDDNDIYNVTLNDAGFVSGGQKGKFQVTAEDGITASQVPSTDIQDGKVVKDWKNGNDKTFVNATDVNADLDAAANVGTRDIVLTAQGEQAWIVSFHGDNAVKGQKAKYNLYNAEGVQLKDPYMVDVRKGSAFEGTVVAKTASNKVASKFYTKQASKTADLADFVFDPSDISGDTDVYPSNAVQQRMVTFDYGDERADATVEVADGESVSEPGAPSYDYGKDDEGEAKTYATNNKNQKLHYEFAGWYADAAFENEYDFSSKVEEDVTLHAKWVVTEIGIDFDPNYGVAKAETKWFKDGDVFVAPEFTRDGWVIDTWTPAGYESWVNALLEIEGKNLKGTRGNGKTEALGASEFKAQWKVDPSATPESLKDILTGLEKKVSITKDGKYIKGKDQKQFTAASFDQYVTDYQKYLKSKGNPTTNEDYAKLIDKLETLQAKLVEVSNASLFRLYNPNDGSHVYTPSAYEAGILTNLGWKNETVAKDAYGVMVKVVEGEKTVVDPLGAEVFRVYNPNSGEHLLTSSEGEAKALEKLGWSIDGAGEAYFHAPQGADRAVYRVYNPNDGMHHYAGHAEASYLVSLGWTWDNGAAPMFYFK